MRSYLELLRLPGAWQFSLAGFIARYPMAMMAMSTALVIPVFYHNYTLAGQLAAINITSFAICAPVLSKLVDRYGQFRVLSKTIAIFGISVFLLAGLIWAHMPGWVLALAIIPVGGFSGAIGAMVRSRWALKVTRPGQLTQAFALEAALDEVAFATGPMFATVLVTAVHPLAGLIACGVIQVCGGYAFIAQRSSEPKPQREVTGIPPAAKSSVLRSKAIIVLGVTYAGAGAIFGALDLAAVAFATEHGARGMAGGMLGICSIGSLLGALFYGARQWPLSQGKLFIIGIVVLAVGNIVVLLAQSMVSLSIILFFMGISIAPTMTNVNAMVQRIVHPSRLTEGLTWLSTFMNIGVGIGAAVGGRMIDVSGSRGGLMVMAASAVIMLAIAIGCAPILRKSLHRADRRRQIALDLQAEAQRRAGHEQAA